MEDKTPKYELKCFRCLITGNTLPHNAYEKINEAIKNYQAETGYVIQDIHYNVSVNPIIVNILFVRG